MSSDFRARVFNLDALVGNENHAIFAKVEEGVSRARRDKEVKRLNEVYQNICQGKEVNEILSYFIKTESYRFLNMWTYEINPKPLRSHADLPPQTEVKLWHIIFLTFNTF